MTGLMIAAVAWIAIALWGTVAATTEAKRQNIEVPSGAIVLAAFFFAPPLILLIVVGKTVSKLRR